MTRFVLRRLALIPIALMLVHFLGFAYAYIAGPIRAARTPYIFVQPDPPPLLPTYQKYVQELVQFELGDAPNSEHSSTELLLDATVASIGLLFLALLLSVLIGLFLGFRALRVNPPQAAQWLTLLSTVGLSMPSFYVGSLFIIASIAYVLSKGSGTEAPFPIRGYGWDIHVVLPVVALMVHPTVKIARITSGLMTEELRKDYVLAARSLGYTWRVIRERLALRNIMSALIVAVAGSLHMLVGELVLVEWLFQWPGLGRLLGWTLIPPLLSSSPGGPLYLNPPTLAAVVTIFAAIYLLADFAAAVLVRVVDPRFRTAL